MKENPDDLSPSKTLSGTLHLIDMFIYEILKQNKRMKCVLQTFPPIHLCFLLPLSF